VKPSAGEPVAIAGEIPERLIMLQLGQGDVLGIRIFARDPVSYGLRPDAQCHRAWRVDPETGDRFSSRDRVAILFRASLGL
jgi:hypothetical protein